ncbi:MAG TPA: SEC-C metal-binding domain-containing protein [Gammaproteobacteria bacterium]
MAAVGRNQPCPCGSGKKYKHCCALKAQKTPLVNRVVMSAIALMLLTGAVVMLTQLDELGSDEPTGPRRVWSEEHGHWH